jgi:hypothetical protein
MPARNMKLTPTNVPNYLGQMKENSSPDTIIKLLSRAANCLSKVGNLTNMQKAIEYYTDAHNLQCDIRGSSHTRSMNIMNLIIMCENKSIHLKRMKRASVQRELEAKKRKDAEKKMKKNKKNKAVDITE